jgi:hypothetical protein
VFRINAVGPDRKPIVLGTADSAHLALKHLQDAMNDHRRAWVTGENNMDVSFDDLVALANDEQRGSS